MNNTGKTIILILLFGIFTEVRAQQSEECNQVLKDKIKISWNNDPREKLYEFTKCGIDSIDINTYYTKLIAKFWIENPHDSTSVSELNMRDIYEDFLSYKETSEFSKLKEITIISKKLASTIVNLEEWDEFEPLLLKVEIPKIYVDKFFEYIQEFDLSEYTYTQAFEKFMNSH
ncbi:hypothetical protein [Moheibacter sediminis]|uniref:Uncharacterized protein n=1 Tax=Moheibacter sediminis TaxID=1434700 RepID=A0A1W1ZF52_9FLAO|nr:hypothetical protein [Moheibacter sediminis]SMC46751.1 hypothetical protein SAMN06296427_102430 [Moheibacter sediminis]